MLQCKVQTDFLSLPFQQRNINLLHLSLIFQPHFVLAAETAFMSEDKQAGPCSRKTWPCSLPRI